MKSPVFDKLYLTIQQLSEIISDSHTCNRDKSNNRQVIQKAIHPYGSRSPGSNGTWNGLGSRHQKPDVKMHSVFCFFLNLSIIRCWFQENCIFSRNNSCDVPQGDMSCQVGSVRLRYLTDVTRCDWFNLTWRWIVIGFVSGEVDSWAFALAFSFLTCGEKDVRI